jgi:hypothetical protein
MKNWSPLYLFGVTLIFFTSSSLSAQPNQDPQPRDQQAKAYRMSFDKLLEFAGEENVQLQQIKFLFNEQISRAKLDGDAFAVEGYECSRDLSMISKMQAMAMTELFELDPNAMLKPVIAKPGNLDSEYARILALHSQLKLLNVTGIQALMKTKEWAKKHAEKNMGNGMIPGINALDTDLRAM